MADLNMLSPEEQNQFNVRRMQAGASLGNQRAQIEFNRANAQGNKAAETSSLTQRFNRMRQQLPGQFNARGVLTSGIYGQGLKDYSLDRTRAFSDLGRKYQQMLSGYGIQQQQAESGYGLQMADIAAQEAMRRAQIAASLRGLI